MLINSKQILSDNMADRVCEAYFESDKTLNRQLKSLGLVMEFNKNLQKKK